MSASIYRWRPRTIVPNILGLFRDIYIGVGNIIRWTPIIWGDRDWDYYFLIKIMHFKIAKMSRCIGNGCHVNAKREEKQMRICMGLLKRMMDDEYASQKNLDGLKTDSKYLGLILGKYITHWWD